MLIYTNTHTREEKKKEIREQTGNRKQMVATETQVGSTLACRYRQTDQATMWEIKPLILK